MPRRNENAFHSGHDRKLTRWDRGYQPIGPEMSRSNPPQGGSGVPNRTIRPPKYDVVSEGYDPRSCIKVTAEQIVRDFRKTEGVNFYKDIKSMRPLFRPPHRPFFLIRWFRAVHPMEYKNSKFLGAIVGVKNNRLHGFIHMLLHGVNWENIFDWNGKVFNWACWAALIACAIYLGIVAYGPFTAKLLR